ncbi:alpha/beta hydrolase [Xenorhabdus sp. 12]|uniref:Alpha/beta hydrolase n=1 Tax=Xenorhabdus santafensis TaxID=2582833 RepID=A0ABU4S3T4_9GAMM|nr:alpha/beta hydrolase [Xenorhabdus sp. 12]MDX7985870.1 alpha/beta hydrolase [Xenorhabdus sp. 12]
MYTVNSNGSTVKYRMYPANNKDHAETIMFLHGTNSDGNSSFSHIKNDFIENLNVVLPDYAGSGESTLPRSLDIEGLADQVISIIEDGNFDKPIHLVGTSLGAVVAAVVAAKQPSSINKLILTAAWASNDDTRFNFLLKTWYELELQNKRMATAFALSHAFSPQKLSEFSHETIDMICNKESKGIAERIKIGLSVNIMEYLVKIKSPTLVIGLTYDTLIPAYMVKEVSSLIPNSLYDEIESGHAVQIENPLPWVNKIKQFIA